jgi:hypothetical protein
MILEDVHRLIGGSESPDSDYMPIACLLNSGYGCVGYFNSSVNESLSDTVVLLNMRLVDLRVEEGHSRRGRIADFNDFLQDVVAQHVKADAESEDSRPTDGTIPLTAIPVGEIAMLYAVLRFPGAAMQLNCTTYQLHLCWDYACFLLRQLSCWE